MCGIAGLIDPELPSVELRAILGRMTDCLVHRGPDDAGHFVHDGVGVGMRRLSIIDVAGGQQPITNETGNLHVVCNGEIYNFRDLRAGLRSRGHSFRSQSDAEVIVHLYEELGEDAFGELRGMFAIAIWDEQRRRLVLARDRLGKKPLYWAHHDRQFLFGSEIKSLLAAQPDLAESDNRALVNYLQFACIQEPKTIYRDIEKLPAGSYAVFENDSLSIRPYWELPLPADDLPAPYQGWTDSQWIDRLDQLLTESVAVRLQSEVPLGVFLSGGLDSSAVVAYAHKAGLRPLKTFTIGFDRPEWDESEDALRVARHFDTDHHVLRLSEAGIEAAAADTLLKIVRHFDEPFGDESALPTWHVSQLAREHVTVILSGDGGDELFAGYSSYQGARFAQQYGRLPAWLGRGLLPPLAQQTARRLPARYRYQALRVAKVLRDSSLPFLQAYRDKVSIWNQRELIELLPDQLIKDSGLLGDQYLPDPLWDVMMLDRDLVQRLTHIDIRSYLLDDILVKVDRMSMAHSLEVRSPLLDHHLVEFAARVPTRLKCQGRRGKVILRKLLHRQLPPRTIQKRKQGFSVPLRDWFQGGLRELVGDYLEVGRGSLPEELFAPAKVQSVLREHQQGVADHSRKIWLLLVYAAWHDLYQTEKFSPCAASLEY